MAANFENDIFVNYSKQDNTPHNPDGANWVDTFSRFLEVILSEMLERDVRIYLEHPAPMMADETIACLNILSPNFADDEQCQISFGRFSEDEGTSRVFSVARWPLEKNLEGALSARLPYNFFHLNDRTGQLEQFEEFETGEVRDASPFWLAMLDLCYDLVEHISKLEGRSVKKDKGSVFLSHAGYDVEDERLLVKRELLRYGYKVLPDKPLPSVQKQAAEAIAQALTDSQFAISLVGDDLGSDVHGSALKLPALENQIAIEHETKVNEGTQDGQTSFKRLIWLKPNVEIHSEEQQQFVNSIKLDANKRDEVELVQCRIEDFKSILIANLALQFSEVVDESNELSANTLRVYLMADTRDLKEYQQLSRWLIKEKFSLLELDPKGSGGARQAQHRKHLENCDYVMVYFDRAKPTWLKTKLQDIIKAPGFGRKNAIKKTIILTGDTTSDDTIMMLVELTPKFESMVLMDASSGIDNLHAHLMDALSD